MNSEKPQDLFEPAWPLDESDLALIDEYRKQAVPVDSLPYTEAFDRIFQRMQAMGDKRDKAAIYRRLINIRKSGRLPPVLYGLAG